MLTGNLLGRGAGLPVCLVATVVLLGLSVRVCTAATEEEIKNAGLQIQNAQSFIAEGKVAEATARLETVKTVAQEHLAERWAYAVQLKEAVVRMQSGKPSEGAAILRALIPLTIDTEQAKAAILVAHRLVPAMSAAGGREEALNIVSAVTAGFRTKFVAEAGQHVLIQFSVAELNLRVGNKEVVEQLLTEVGPLVKQDAARAAWASVAGKLVERQSASDDLILVPKLTSAAQANGAQEPLMNVLLSQVRIYLSSGSAEIKERGIALFDLIKTQAAGISSLTGRVATLEDVVGFQRLLQTGDKAAIVAGLEAASARLAADTDGTKLLFGQAHNVLRQALREKDAATAEKMAKLLAAPSMRQVSGEKDEAKQWAKWVTAAAWSIITLHPETEEKLAACDRLTEGLAPTAKEILLRQMLNAVRARLTGNNPNAGIKMFEGIKQRATDVPALAAEIAELDQAVALGNLTKGNLPEAVANLEAAYGQSNNWPKMLHGQAQNLLGRATRAYDVASAERVVKLLARPEMLQAGGGKTEEEQWAAWSKTAWTVIALNTNPDAMLASYDRVTNGVGSSAAKEVLLRNILVQARGDLAGGNMDKGMALLDGVQARSTEMAGLAKEVAVVGKMGATYALVKAGNFDGIPAALEETLALVREDQELARCLYAQSSELLKRVRGVKDQQQTARAILKFLAKSELRAASGPKEAKEQWEKWAEVPCAMIGELPPQDCIAFYENLLPALDSGIPKEILVKRLLWKARQEIIRDYYGKGIDPGIALFGGLKKHAGDAPGAAAAFQVTDGIVSAIRAFRGKEQDELSAVESIKSGSRDHIVPHLKNGCESAKGDPELLAGVYEVGEYLYRRLLRVKEYAHADALVALLFQKDLQQAARLSRPWKSLAYEYVMARDYPAWLTLAEAEIKKNADNPDVKAFWLMSKAYYKSVVKDKFEPREGLGWVEAAMSAAASPEVRLTVAMELMRYYEDINRPAVGISVLASIKEQYTEKEKAAIEAMEKHLRKVQAESEDAAKQTEALRKEAQRQGLLKYYRKRLEAVKGDQETIAKLQAAIADLEASASPPGTKGDGNAGSNTSEASQEGTR